MGTSWEGDSFKKQMRELAARQLFAGAKHLVNEHKKRLGILNPKPYNNPAKIDEYPHLRTGRGRANIMAEPNSVSEIMQTMSVRVGIGKLAPYMAWLADRGWRGLLDTYRDIQGQIAAIIGGASASVTE